MDDDAAQLWTQFLEFEDDDDPNSAPMTQQLTESYLVGFVIVNIVGLKYYSGRINGREMVGLVREPLNPYDPNAIKVLNTRMAQVGHLERAAAAALAPLIDSHLITAVEGIVPKPPRNPNPFRLPCQVHIFALPDAAPIVAAAVEAAGLHLIVGGDHEFGLSESAIVMENNKKKKGERSVDKIFALVGKDKSGKNAAAMEANKEVVKTELFEHQKQGLGWMVWRENSSDLPPFWEEKDGGFLNMLTNHHTQERPEPLNGGIFADDMGLGKTLTLISLIATNGIKLTLGKKVANSRKKRKVDDEGVGPKATLVVCPSSVLMTWVSQLEEHTSRGSLKLYLYHGERTKEPKELAKHDIVLTTYKTLALEFSASSSPLVDVEWLRVIIDEAHVIKNFVAQQTKAVIALKAKRRWVVTGTPIQNSSLDLFSLMAFLRFQPFSIKSYWQSLVQRPLAQGSKTGISRLQVRAPLYLFILSQSHASSLLCVRFTTLVGVGQLRHVDK